MPDLFLRQRSFVIDDREVPKGSVQLVISPSNSAIYIHAIYNYNVNLTPSNTTFDGYVPTDLNDLHRMLSLYVF